jgi:hypothetical protein
MNPIYRWEILLTIDSHWPDEESAAEGAADLVNSIRADLTADETLVRSSVMVRRRRTDGEIHD